MGNSITIFREIALIQIVTEHSKEISRQKLKAQMSELEQEQRDYEEEKNKTLTEFTLRGAGEAHLNSLRQKLDNEMSKFFIQGDEIRTNLEAVEALQENQEIIIGSLEGPHELKIGDDLPALSRAQVVIKDGVVVEIRM